MEDPKTSPPPKWWLSVIKDIEKAALAAKNSFMTTNTVLGKSSSDTDELLGYYIRQQNGKVGFYSIKDLKRPLPIGVVIRGALPKPQAISEGPLISSYIFNTIKDNVNMIPKLWLSKVITKIMSGEPVTPKNDFKDFPEWVQLPPNLKKDKALIDLLYRAVRYEGLKGLSRYNDMVVT